MDISFLQGSGIEALPQFLTSLALGLLIGLERERNPSAKAGLRTFALVAMFGTLAALLSTKLDTPWLLIAGLLTVAIMIIAAYLNDPGIDTDPGTTTVIALLMSYGLGAMIWYGLAKLAVMLGIGITALLYFKPELRGLSQRMTRRDLVSILQFSALTFVILPILPNQNYGVQSLPGMDDGGADLRHEPGRLRRAALGGPTLRRAVAGLPRRLGIKHGDHPALCTTKQGQCKHGAAVCGDYSHRQPSGADTSDSHQRHRLSRAAPAYPASDGARLAVRHHLHLVQLEQAAQRRRAAHARDFQPDRDSRRAELRPAVRCRAALLRLAE
jgi:hypothetical protein